MPQFYPNQPAPANEKATAIDQVLGYVRVVYETDDLVELRLLRGGEVSRRYVLAEKLHEQIGHLGKQNAAGWNVYVGVNPRVRHGGTAADVKFARCIFSDFDKTTIEAVLAKLAKLKLPPPTLIVNSGHGVHVYWRLDEPQANRVAWQTLQADLIILIKSDPAVKGWPQVMRLPGFLNVKADPVPCTIIEGDPTRRYLWEDLRQMIPSPTKKVKVAKHHAAQTVTTPTPNTSADSEAGISPDELLDIALRRVGSGTRHQIGVWLACQLRDNRVSKVQAETTMQSYQQRVPAGDHEYTLDEAMETLAGVYSSPSRDPWHDDDIIRSSLQIHKGQGSPAVILICRTQLRRGGVV
ncbi:MAG: DNA-primase RepB domain-containing protein [Planctomycetota bacterium]|nr:DNA-primase RepB domain-containing protein [Planctomycetota bacterium]